MKLLCKTVYISSLSNLSIICCVFLWLLCCENGDAITIPKNETIPAVIVFGDSIVDPGNNNDIKTIVKCNFPPYGKDFVGASPTGRFSNGKVPSDIVAEIFGVKELLPAYLTPNLEIQDLLTGVSFASGGSGYDPLTSQLVSVLSLSDQVHLFKEYIQKINNSVGENRTSTILSNSVFVVCTGSDDIANTYFGTPFRKKHYDINSYSDLMVRSASSFFQEIYGLGARRIAVFGAPPIGCVPSQRTLRGDKKRDCAKSHNQLAMLFNSKLSTEIASLNKKLPQSRLVYFDIYSPILSLIQNPSPYGFETVNRGCCGTGLVEVSILCNNLDHTCTDIDKFIFWDSYHPTEKAYKILVPQILSKQVDELFAENK